MTDNANVTITRFVAGPIDTNMYVVSDKAGHAVVFDPSRGCGEALGYIADHKLQLGGIILTHGHFDHLLGVDEIRAEHEVDVWVHPAEKALVRQSGLNGSDIMGLSYFYGGPLRELNEGDMEIGGIAMRVLHVPGHSPGGCAFLIGKDLICGDALFAGSVGRADLPGGNFEQLIAAIKEKLLTLPSDTVVWPGHGNRTTIGRETRLNPFLV
ncbi:MAG: MBL fold metallo-hydrolase [Chitinivibrionales bacterium]|nr:MBL fold metallo-hydrolase [Chitinivibrionales bacterium]